MYKKSSILLFFIIMAFICLAISGCSGGSGSAAGGGFPGAGTLTGVVKNSSGQPIAGAEVTLVFRSELTISGATDAQGRFTLNNVPNGSYQLRVCCSGYQDYTKIVSMSGGGTINLVVSMEQIQTAAVTGVVTDSETGDPISGAVVTVGIKTGMSGEDGSYSINDIQPGSNIAMAALKSGYQNYFGSVTLAENQTSTVNFKMIRVAPDSGSVTGTVTDASSGLGIDGVVVIIGNLAAITTDGGKYTINGLDEGAGQPVKATHSNYIEYNGTVDVTVGNVTIHDFTMSFKTGSVSGVITDSDSSIPLQGVRVVIGDKVAFSGADGSYNFPGVSIGSGLTITATFSGYYNYSGALDVSYNTATNHNFTMTAVPPPTGSVSGVVTDSETSNGLDGVLVMAGGLSATTSGGGTLYHQRGC